MKCLRCDAEMKHIGTQRFQLGQTSWLLGDLPNLLAGSLEVHILCCPDCGKLEFFRAEGKEDELPTKRCPSCGKEHDFDYPKCPFCKHDYYGK